MEGGPTVASVAGSSGSGSRSGSGNGSGSGSGESRRIALINMLNEQFAGFRWARFPVTSSCYDAGKHTGANANGGRSELTEESLAVEFSTVLLQPQAETDVRKPAIFFCHGLASNRTVWRECGLYLARQGFPVAYCDLVGHGDSTSALFHGGVRSGSISKYSIDYICHHLQEVLTRMRMYVSDMQTSSTASSVCEPTEQSSGCPVAVAGKVSVHQCSPSDLASLLPSAWAQPVVFAGHSYGGAIAFEMGIRHPDLIRSIVCVDGGFINLQKLYPDFASCIMKLCPPPFLNISYAALEGIIRTEWCRGWSELGIQSMLNNFRELTNHRHLDACNVEPKLIAPMHSQLLQDFWKYDPLSRSALVTQPVLLLPSKEAVTPFTGNKHDDVQSLLGVLCNGHLFQLDMCEQHDIPAQHPKELATQLVRHFEEGLL
jgi:pimeloyl-ACP methyl ester carboxylesterase